MSGPARVLLVFLDGVGIGPDDPERNPFFRTPLPTVERLAGGAPPSLDRLAGGAAPVLGRLTAGAPSALDRRTDPNADTGSAFFPLDATLGVDGTPQSGTGQTALLTGLDAGALFGGHFGPWIPVRLRPLVEEQSVLRRVASAGGRVAFANAYPRGWPGRGGSRRIAGPPLAARGAGVLDRHEEALERGEAVSSEIVNDGWRRVLGHHDVPEIDGVRAGHNLAAIAGRHDLTLFAHYATDTAGHTRDMDPAVRALELVDRFLGGVLERLPADTLLLVTSDHGNIEDVEAGHTRNPALGLAAGPGADEAAAMRDLRDVAPFISRVLGAD